jgi:hypothetical protein
VRQPDRLSLRERLERLRQCLSARHFGFRHKNRDDRLAVPQRRFDLDANKILRTVEAPSPRVIARGQPLWTDQHQHRVAASDLILNDLHKVSPRLDALDVHEQICSRKRLSKAQI